MPMKSIKSNRQISVIILLLLSIGVQLCSAQNKNAIKQFVYFGRDNEGIHETSFYKNPNIEGAQIVYTWRQLEKEKGVYDFEDIKKDLAFLKVNGKKLFIQIQDVSFDSARVCVPKYIVNDTLYHGGITPQYGFVGDDEDKAVNEGWTAIRWDKAVAERFHVFLKALGKEFDGKIEGVNLQETAVEYGSTGKLFAKGFTPEKYRDAIKANMLALKQAFPKSVTIIYANFMPGESLPDHNNHYLSDLYDYAKEIKIGVGGPDILVYRKGQMDNSYGLIRESSGIIPVAMAVQDGNYSTLNPQTARKVTVPEIYNFAKNYLKVNYIFWGRQEPFYKKKVLPFLKNLKRSVK
jgi:hypothetical protein